MTKYIPLGNRLLISPIEAETKVGSLYVPPSAENKETMNGEILEIAEDIEKHSPALKPGDIVRYDVYCGTKLPDGTKLIELKDILAIVRLSDN